MKRKGIDGIGGRGKRYLPRPVGNLEVLTEPKRKDAEDACAEVGGAGDCEDPGPDDPECSLE